MTHSFTANRIVTKYPKSEGFVFNKDTGDIEQHGKLIAPAFTDIQSPVGYRDVFNNNRTNQPRYVDGLRDPSMAGYLIEFIPTKLYPAGWDKRSSFWEELFNEIKDRVPQLMEVERFIPCWFDTTTCAEISDKLGHIVGAPNPNIHLQVVHEVFTLAARNEGFVIYQ